MSRPPLSRDAVIRRAADLADGSGLASVTLSAVARSLGVQAPSLYGHVRDLAALRDGVTVLALEELDELSGAAIAGRAHRDALQAFCDAYRDYARAHPGRWEALQRRASEDVVRSEAAARSGRTTAAVLRGYGIEATETVHATRLIGSFLNGFVALEQIGAFSHSQPDPDASWEQLVDRLHLLLARWTAQDAHHTPGANP